MMNLLKAVAMLAILTLLSALIAVALTYPLFH